MCVVVLRAVCHLHRSFSYEEFIAAQDKFQRRQADQLAIHNEEVARAIEDVIVLVQVCLCCNTAHKLQCIKGLHHAG